MLAELVAQDAEGQSGPEDRDVEAGQDVRERADVVLVAVGEDDAAHPLATLDQPAHIGDHQVDAEHLGLGEHQAGVDDHDVLAAFDREEVAADLTEPPEGHEAKAVDPGWSGRRGWEGGGGECQNKLSWSRAAGSAGRAGPEGSGAAAAGAWRRASASSR